MSFAGLVSTFNIEMGGPQGAEPELNTSAHLGPSWRNPSDTIGHCIEWRSPNFTTRLIPSAIIGHCIEWQNPNYMTRPIHNAIAFPDFYPWP